jgi:hypothetical protein
LENPNKVLVEQWAKMFGRTYPQIATQYREMLAAGVQFPVPTDRDMYKSL